jgi:hypothetical protein
MKRLCAQTSNSRLGQKKIVQRFVICVEVCIQTNIRSYIISLKKRLHQLQSRDVTLHSNYSLGI